MYSRLMMMKKDKKKKQLPFLPDELITEILSLANVKTIIRFKCVSKSWNSLISDPSFIQKHLKNSSQNHVHLILTPPGWIDPMSTVKSLPVSRLPENPSITVSDDFCHWGSGLDDYCKIVNSCNGLLCFLFYCDDSGNDKYWFCIWNPATRTKSKAFGTFYSNIWPDYLKFTFGFDNLTGTYKVVEFPTAEQGSLGNQMVRVLSLSDGWRCINGFPLVPLVSQFNNGVYLSGTIYWLAVNVIHNYFYPCYYDQESFTHSISLDQFKIVSLDLSTETYMQFRLPSGFDEAPRFEPTLQVLLDRLCFAHDFKETQFVIWQMNEYGFQESWTQLFRIDYFNLDLKMHNLSIRRNIPLLLPLYLNENGGTLILAYSGDNQAVNIYNQRGGDDDQAVIYNQRENRVKKVKISYNYLCRFFYVESLI